MSVRRLVQVKTMEQQQAEEAAARREDELASERLRWQLMQVWSTLPFSCPQATCIVSRLHGSC